MIQIYEAMICDYDGIDFQAEVVLVSDVLALLEQIQKDASACDDTVWAILTRLRAALGEK